VTSDAESGGVFSPNLGAADVDADNDAEAPLSCGGTIELQCGAAIFGMEETICCEKVVVVDCPF